MTENETTGARQMLAEVDQIELEIEKLVSGGFGLGRWQGIPILVPRAAPGDRARVRLTERRPDFARGEIAELLAPGPGRRTAACPHFADCGGCDLQHLDERTQLRWKSAATLETLRRVSGLTLPAPRQIVAGAPWGYRLRAQLHTETEGDRVRAGYFARDSRRLVAIERCPVLDPALEEAALAVGDRYGDGAGAPAPRRIDLASGDDGGIASAPPVAGLAAGEIVRSVAGFAFHFDARCFFQAHAGLLDRLVDEVVGDDEGESAYDLFAGVGLFSLPLSRRYARVVSVEGDRNAGRYARKNARLARCAGVECVDRPVESWLPAGFPAGADRVVVDPPRTGLPPLVRRLLVARPAARLTYASCHPATLARDLRELVAAYDLDSVVLLDLFPQTGHMETVVQLVRKEAP